MEVKGLTPWPLGVHLISPNNITPRSHIKEIITNCRSSWLSNKFNILGKVYRTVWRICILILGSKGLITLVRITWTESVPTFVRNFEICPLPQPRSRAIGKCLRKENKVRKESKLIIFLTTKNIYKDKPWDVSYSVNHPFSNLGKKKQTNLLVIIQYHWVSCITMSLMINYC